MTDMNEQNEGDSDSQIKYGVIIDDGDNIIEK